jgi:hypothetical protein
LKSSGMMRRSRPSAMRVAALAIPFCAAAADGGEPGAPPALPNAPPALRCREMAFGTDGAGAGVAGAGAAGAGAAGAVTAAPAGFGRPVLWQEARSRAAMKILTSGSHLLTIPCTTPRGIGQTWRLPVPRGAGNASAPLQNPRRVIL